MEMNYIFDGAWGLSCERRLDAMAISGVYDPGEVIGHRRGQNLSDPSDKVLGPRDVAEQLFPPGVGGLDAVPQVVVRVEIFPVLPEILQKAVSELAVFGRWVLQWLFTWGGCTHPLPNGPDFLDVLEVLVLGVGQLR